MMGQLEDMSIFARVVEAGSITKAAEQLNLAKSAVSKRLSALEQRLGQKLITRTTRRSNLTDAGKTYYQRSKLILDEVAELNNQATFAHQSLSGSLKISVPVSFGLMYLADALDDFIKLYPDIHLQVNFSDHAVDLIESGYDLAIRIGNLNNSSLQARKLAPIKQLLCASPTYLSKYGNPKSHNDLVHHKFLRYDNISMLGINLLDNSGQTINVQRNNYYSANNGDFLAKLAKSGHGILQTPNFFVWKAIQEGELVPILEQYKLAQLDAYAVYPANRHLPQKVRVLIDYLVEYFISPPFA